MNLVARECPIVISLIPQGNDMLEMELKINSDEFRFISDTAMCGQFNQLMSIVYQLYSEEWDTHNTNYRRFNRDWRHEDSKTWVSSGFKWVNDTDTCSFTFSRLLRDDNAASQIFEPDIITTEIKTIQGISTYFLNGIDLAYAIGKAGTSILKEYGLYGYSFSTGSKVCPGDSIDLNQLIFFKAYALGALSTRKLTIIDESKKSWVSHTYSSFDEELKLLLFDM